MNLPQVPFDLLTRDSSVFLQFSADASDLGWAPGQWPQAIWAVSPSGFGREYTCTKVEADGTHLYSSELDHTSIRIFND